jgi:anti-anti-sigma factor
MSVHLICEQKRTRVIFDGALTIYEAHTVRNTLLDALSEAQPVEMDLTGVTEIDLSGLQLLMTVRNEPNLKFVTGVSSAVNHTLQLLNLRKLLHVHAVDAGS